ncbi:tyrosine-type recombinase/integrase [Nocardia jiangxiensis]|uniref:tyrosine-type recombinase/integrase n=1 Tax=Nocardia jiangxiensis TaxID=282685 RepID=UPI0002EEC1CD|nr:tyrosine-type recombinase/integrase [Nocardia jiangxiensis]
MPQEKMAPGAEPKQKLVPIKGDDDLWHLGPIRHRAWSGSYHRSSGKGKTRKECLDDFWRRFEVNRNKGARVELIAEMSSPATVLTLDSMMSDAFDEFRKFSQQRFENGELARRTLNGYISAIYPGDPDRKTSRPDAIRMGVEMGRLSIREVAQVTFIVGYFRSVGKAYPGVAEMQFKVLSAVFTWMTDELHLFDISPMKLIKKPKYTIVKAQRALKPAERAALKDALGTQFSGDRRAAQWPYYVVMLILATGARPGEILALRWCDILDIDGDYTIVHICGHTERITGQGKVRTEGRKAGQPYYITLPAWSARILREWRDKTYTRGNDEALCFTVKFRKQPQPITTESVDFIMERRLKGTSVAWARPGNLRDTVATEVAGRTGDPSAASTQLGHTAASSVAVRHYIDAEGFYLFVVDYSEQLEYLDPESDIKVTIRASGRFVEGPRPRVLQRI